MNTIQQYEAREIERLTASCAVPSFRPVTRCASVCAL